MPKHNLTIIIVQLNQILDHVRYMQIIKSSEPPLKDDSRQPQLNNQVWTLHYLNNIP